MLRRLAIILTMAVLCAGCSTVRAGIPVPPPKSSSSPTTTTAPSTSQLSTYSQAQLAQTPCDALDTHDLVALGVTGQGKQEAGKDGAACEWRIADQNVSLQLDAPLSYAQTMTKDGRVSQVPVGQHEAVQAEFQGICFIFVALSDVDHLVAATAIPVPGGSQDGACPAAASVAAAALTHIQ